MHSPLLTKLKTPQISCSSRNLPINVENYQCDFPWKSQENQVAGRSDDLCKKIPDPTNGQSLVSGLPGN